VKAKSQVYLYARWGNLILKMQHSTSRQAKQKICANLDHHWSKKCSFLCVQTNWVCPLGTQRYCKNDSDSSLESLTVTRVESFCEKRDSSRVRVTTNHDSTRVESLTRVTLSLLTNTKKNSVKHSLQLPWLQDDSFEIPQSFQFSIRFLLISRFSKMVIILCHWQKECHHKCKQQNWKNSRRNV